MTDLKKIRVIQIHGNGGGSGKDNWHPFVHKTLKELGLNVLTPNFPDSTLAREKYWLPFLSNKLKADKNTILIGHSSGAIAAMRFAENNKIYGLILVATYHTDLDDKQERKSGYFNRSWQWAKIKNNVQWIVQFASTDDPYIPIKEARYINKHLKTEYHEYTKEGHFGFREKKKQFPEIVNVVKKKLELK